MNAKEMIRKEIDSIATDIIIKTLRFLSLSEKADMTIEPPIPPISTKLPKIPASTGVNPLGANINSIYVEIILNAPNPIKKVIITIQNRELVRRAFNPSRKSMLF